MIVSVSTIGLYLLSAIHSKWFHALSRFPGPFLWSITRFPMAYNIVLGRLNYRVTELHEKYGMFKVSLLFCSR